MGIYETGRNTVSGITFELFKSMPGSARPLLQQLGENYLRSLAERYPSDTLMDSCERIRQERGVVLGTQTMCKLFRRVGLTHKTRRELATSSKRIPAGLV